MSIIGRLAGENNRYTFQSCTFKDNKSNKNGEILEVLWTLNFKAVSLMNKDLIKNYSLSVILKPNGKEDEPNFYKITSIKLD